MGDALPPLDYETPTPRLPTLTRSRAIEFIGVLCVSPVALFVLVFLINTKWGPALGVMVYVGVLTYCLCAQRQRAFGLGLLGGPPLIFGLLFAIVRF